MTTTAALAYVAQKTIVQHPVETLAAVKTVAVTVAPVALPLAAAAGIGYGIYKLFSE